jgi:hypothetical protein
MELLDLPSLGNQQVLGDLIRLISGVDSAPMIRDNAGVDKIESRQVLQGVGATE